MRLLNKILLPTNNAKIYPKIDTMKRFYFSQFKIITSIHLSRNEKRISNTMKKVPCYFYFLILLAYTSVTYLHCKI